MRRPFVLEERRGSALAAMVSSLGLGIVALQLTILAQTHDAGSLVRVAPLAGTSIVCVLAVVTEGRPSRALMRLLRLLVLFIVVVGVAGLTLGPNALAACVPSHYGADAFVVGALATVVPLGWAEFAKRLRSTLSLDARDRALAFASVWSGLVALLCAGLGGWWEASLLEAFAIISGGLAVSRDLGRRKWLASINDGPRWSVEEASPPAGLLPLVPSGRNEGFPSVLYEHSARDGYRVMDGSVPVAWLIGNTARVRRQVLKRTRRTSACALATLAAVVVLVNARASNPVPAQLALGDDLGTCVRMSDGTARCWGGVRPSGYPPGWRSIWQELFGTSSFRFETPAPRVVAGMNDIRALEGQCAVRSDGAIWCRDHYDPHEASPSLYALQPSVVGVADIAGNAKEGCASLRDGSVQCWGNDWPAGLPGAEGGPSTLRDVVAIGYAEPAAACALRGDGSVWCWGTVGVGRVIGLPAARRIAVGAKHRCALVRDGGLWCWGANGKGQLGIGSKEDQATPVRVRNLEGVEQVAIGGAEATCATTRDGSVFCWGDNEGGLLGDGSLVGKSLPSRVGCITTARTVAVGKAHACALTRDDTLWCWGTNTAGEIGIAPTEPWRVTIPVAVDWHISEERSFF